jgi:transcriptional regulator with XRE-family HTH domain
LDVTGLAEEIGYGRQYVSKVINGNYNSIVAQEKIAVRLGVELDSIFPAVEPENTRKVA